MILHSPYQPFARGQGQPLLPGPFLGGEILALPVGMTAGNSVSFNHNLRAFPRHAEVIQPITGEYPSRIAITAFNTSSITVKFESAQSAGAFLFIW